MNNIWIFKDSELAHKYCIGKGIEIGAAAHNPFNLADCINVAIPHDHEFYKQNQIEMCGKFVQVDYFTSADKLLFSGDNEYDYIVSSHVIEHLQDLIGTFIEWKRVLKPDGIIFIIFPKRDALPEDVGRPLSHVGEMVYNHLHKPEIFDSTKHVWVLDLQVMKNLIDFCNNYFSFNFEIIDMEETDTKVGNGHTIVLKVKK
jgi:predicted SAM-dependent methyltransferase